MSRRARAPRSTPGMRLRASAPPVVAIALVTLAAFLPQPKDPQRPPETVPVSRTAYACPAGARVATGQIAPSHRVQAVEVPGGKRVSRLESGDTWRRVNSKRAVVVEQFGRGSGAVGFFSATAGPSLLAGSCPATADESWFVGLGSGAKHDSRLVLANLSNLLGVADVTLWGTEGPIESVGAHGILLKPGETRTLKLDGLAAGEPELAVRVVRRRGAFAVTAIDSLHRVFGGAEVAPPTAPLSRHQLVSGFPAGARNRSLLIVNPSTATSRVSVSVLGPDGDFAPRGLEAVRVPAGRVTVVDLPSSLGKDGLAVRLSSEEPIAVTARVAETKKDYAFASASPRIDGPAVIPVDLGGGTGRPRLTLTAPNRRATLTVKGYDAHMKPLGSKRYAIAGGTTSTVNLAQLTDSPDLAYVVAVPSGNLVGVATFHKDDGIASIPIGSAPMRVLGPDVRFVG